MRIETVWVVFHMDIKHYDTIEKEMKKKGYKNIKVYVPTISILKKRSKGQNIYEDVPMLFSYGFMRMPLEKAYDRPFLHSMKKDIQGIQSWVKSLETMHLKKLKKRVDNAEDWDDFSLIGIISKKEIRRFKKISKYNKVYSKYDIAQLELGAYIVLRGYPFEGIQATVLEVSLINKQVKVKLFPNGGIIEVWLPFDNVLYSVYQDHDANKLSNDHAEDNISNSYKLTSEQEEYEYSR